MNDKDSGLLGPVSNRCDLTMLVKLDEQMNEQTDYS